AGLHRRQEVGADIGEALGGHTQRNRIDGGQLGADRSHIEGDGGELIPQEDCHSLRGGLQITQACDGQPAGLIQGGQDLGQGHGSAGNGRRWESFALGVLGHGFSSLREFRVGSGGVSGGQAWTPVEIREAYYIIGGTCAWIEYSRFVTTD